MTAPASERLDQRLVALGHFATRSRARDAVLRGAVTVGGRVADKPGMAVGESAVIAVDDPANAYVSRAALKLIAGLDGFGLSPRGCCALDIGASTGGFTQVLLERGAARVFAIDVGHGQMHPLVAADPRVTLVEGLNARELAADDLGGVRPDFLVCDVSFISLRLALPKALALAAPGAKGIFLVKPQFEAGRDGVGKGGLVDPSLAERIAGELAQWLGEQPGWRSLGLAQSPIEGGDGNHEFLLAGEKKL